MSNSRQITTLVLAALGLLGSILGSSLLSNANQLAAGDNPFGIYRSAYGKLLARLGETTIDRIWHLGVEQIVPHYMSGDKAITTSTEASESDGALAEATPAKPLVESAKAWLQKRVVSQHSRTNPYALSSSHRERVHKDLENLMRRSYRLDPTHYGAYNSYNLFITHQEFGGTADSRELAKTLAEDTIRLIEQEDEDPEVFLTAASASMNLFLLETEDARISGSQIQLATLQKYREQIAGFLTRFETLQTNAEDSGDWDYLSMDRQVEIAHRYRFTKRTFQQFDAMIARYESPDSEEVTAEVAEKKE
ncbi:MAG: hypothetical protein AAF733_00450 [Verrucomicrobiota bacterium]